MSVKYRLYFESYGEFLERMATGLLDKFVNELNRYSTRNYYSYLFCVNYIKPKFASSERLLTIEIYDGVTLNVVEEHLNTIFKDFFLEPTLKHKMIKLPKISISIEKETWDKYNKTYMKIMKIHDQEFLPYHNNAIARWLGKKYLYRP